MDRIGLVRKAILLYGGKIEKKREGKKREKKGKRKKKFFFSCLVKFVLHILFK